MVQQHNTHTRASCGASGKTGRILARGGTAAQSIAEHKEEKAVQHNNTRYNIEQVQLKKRCIQRIFLFLAEMTRWWGKSC